MKKIGIVTIIDNNNYGNRLQNYAVYKKLKISGHEVEVIKNIKHFNNKTSVYVQAINTLKFIKHTVISAARTKRKINFLKFNELIKFSEKTITAYTRKVDNYDFFIVGSDQVWKPLYLRMSDVDLLSFAEPEKRISFSASFGISELPECYREKAAKELKKFKAISVREYSGEEIVNGLTQRDDVEVLLDPTMLLSSEEWDEISNKPRMLKEGKFILNYFLGNLSEQRKIEIEKLAKENDCEIINILDKKSPFYECGPSEFLYLEKHAFLICTDSFHSSVFAVIYNRPFVVFNREQEGMANMNSRVDTLISKLKLENRVYNNESLTKENIHHDYTEAYSILEKERKKSEDFLKRALEIDLN